MFYRNLADLILLAHLGFVLFVALGGLLVLRWPKLIWLHMPAAVWGVLIEFMGWMCPLTPLENRFRRLGGEAGYEGGFVEHYITSLLYPSGLSREVQMALGLVVLAINGLIYARFFCSGRWRKVR